MPIFRFAQLFVYLLWCCIKKLLSFGKINIMSNFDSVKTMFLGASGIGGVELTSAVVEASASEGANIIQVVIQIVIGIATLIGMFRKKSNNHKN
jgi:predicted AAA+ superfamily ATPase